jgi:hypothetical protein
MCTAKKSRLRIAAFLVCIFANPGFGLAQEEKRYLDAGKGRPPFDITRHSVPIEEILSGGPPRDGIPALSNPMFVSADDGDQFLKKHDKVLAIEYNGVAKAYPIRILNWHEVVNDNFNGKPVVVTWCPLCLSGIIYDPENVGSRLTFGVSGKIYKSNLLMYDHETGSLWSQMLQRAISGPLIGAVLVMLPAEHSTWEHWRTQHPNTLVLSLDTGFKRDYGLDPYREYVEQGRPTFRSPQDIETAKEKINPMERVLGIAVGGIQKAYPFEVLKKKPEQFAEKVGETTVVIHFDRKSKTAWVTTKSGAVLPSTTVFWFAWRDFYPQTQILAKER